MESHLAKAIKLDTQPVAVIYSDVCPENALQYKEGVWGCTIALLNAASKGKTAVMSDQTTVCRGGKVGLGFGKFKPGMEYFLSIGDDGPKPGEHYKKDPKLALNYMESVPDVVVKPYIIFKPINELSGGETPEIIVFLVNADQLSGLTTLANYDKETQNNVQLMFGAGCVQSILYPIYRQQAGQDVCYIGLTDPSARKCISKDILSFSIPYHRFLRMEAEVKGSFFDTDTWGVIYNRI